MRKIILFMMISADGYFEGEHHELDWHNTTGDFNDYVTEMFSGVDTLLFGRVTYEMMASYWQMPGANQENPQEVVDRMNDLPKLVVSTTLQSADWHNTTLINQSVAETLAQEKQKPGKNIALLSSSKLAVSLLQLGLLDEIRLMVNPVVLGKGHAVFNGLDKERDLKLISQRTLQNGNVLLTYTLAS